MIHGKVAKNLPLFAHLELKVQTNFTAAGEAKLLGHFQPGGCDAAHAAGRAVGGQRRPLCSVVQRGINLDFQFRAQSSEEQGRYAR